MIYGVACDSEGFVIGLDPNEELISDGLGTASSFFSLKSLQTLKLIVNNFSFVIPSGFNKLVMLDNLNLSYASFVGQIPIEIPRLFEMIQ